MKKFLIAFCMMISLCSLGTFAQTYWYRSFQFASASVYNGNYRWSDWESSNVNISIDFDNDKVVIYSPTTQYYQILSCGNWVSDGKGGSEVYMKFIDGDGDRGTMSLRIESNGNSQLYVRFNNVAWVYNLKRTY